MSDNDRILLEQVLAKTKAETAPEMSDSDFWEFFTAEQLLRDFQLDPDELDSGLVGTEKDASDGGIDSIFIMVNGVLIRDVEQARKLSHKKGVVLDVVIIQSKRSKGFEMAPVLRLGNTCKNIFSVARQLADFTERYNSLLLDVINRFREAHSAVITAQPEVNVHIYYASLADASCVNSDIGTKAREVEEDIKGMLATVSSCRFAFMGARELISLWQRPQKFQFTLNTKRSFSDRRGGWVALLDIGEYYNLISENGALREHLFESNVRDYEGEVEVNKQIRKTLDAKSDGVNFWWLNNGVTIIADKISPTSEYAFTLHEPQIVNGLQSSQVIFDYFRETQANPIEETRDLVIRMIQSDEDETRDRIIKATNSQTKIPAQYLRASDEIQRKIEISFRGGGMHYDRRKNSWRKTNIPISRVVGVSELAQSVASIVLGEADHARARPSRYFKDLGNYRKVFSEKFHIQTYLTCARLKKKVEEFLKRKDLAREVRTDLMFYVLMAVGHPIYKRGALREIDVDSIPDKELDDALELVSRLYFEYGGSDTVAKGPDLVKGLLRSLFPERDSVPRVRIRVRG